MEIALTNNRRRKRAMCCGPALFYITHLKCAFEPTPPPHATLPTPLPPCAPPPPPRMHISSLALVGWPSWKGRLAHCPSLPVFLSERSFPEREHFQREKLSPLWHLAARDAVNCQRSHHSALRW